MQFTSSGIPTFGWIWRTTPGFIKIAAVLLLIGIVIVIIVKISREVARAKELFFTHPKHRKQMISTDYIKSHVDSLIDAAKQLAQKSHQAMEQDQDDKAVSLAAASAAFLQSAYVIMPKHTLEKQPHYAKLQQDVNTLLKTQYNVHLPTIRME